MIDAVNHPFSCGAATTTFSSVFTKRPIVERSFDLEVTEVRRVTATGSVSSVTVDDAVYTTQTGASYETDFGVEVVYRQANYGQAVTITSDTPAVLSAPGEDGTASYESSGTAILRGASEDGEVFLVSAETSSATGSVDAFNEWIAGSAAKQCEVEIDGRLEGSRDVYSSQDTVTGLSFARNANFFASDIDLTCVSPWNSSGKNTMSGTLISPRHVLFAAHFQPSAGASIRFVQADGTVVTRTLSAIATHPGYAALALYPDLAVGVLDQDVPAGISFAKVLPDDWRDYMPSLSPTTPVPCIRFNQFGRVSVAEWRGGFGVSNDPNSAVRFTCGVPTDAGRLEYYEPVVLFDSGCPSFIVVNGEPVLLGPFSTGGAGTGTLVSGHAEAVNDMMSTLGGGYQLTTVDLSEFPTYS